MIEVQAAELSTRIEDLLVEVEKGETVVVTRDGRPVARLAPENWPSAEADRRAALGRLKALRATMPSATVDEIISWRDEGRRY